MAQRHSNYPNEKGITLIALVITIIVLLILAGITISSISTNESAINKAQESKITTERVEAEEELYMSVIKIKNDYFINKDDKITYYTNKSTFVEKSGFDENMYTIKTYTLDENTNKVTIVIVKRNGSGVDLEFEIDLENDIVTCNKN